MQELSTKNFGILVAYILPGATALLGVAAGSEALFLWVSNHVSFVPALAGVLYSVPATLACGLVISAARWIVFDSIHHVTGVKRPRWDDRMLSEHLLAFQYLVENHYRYYQFYANTLTAVLIAGAVAWYEAPGASRTSALIAVGILSIVLFAGSRDALRKYYARVERLLGTISPGKEFAMTNGNHSAETAGNGPRQAPELKPKTGKEVAIENSPLRKAKAANSKSK